MSSGQSNSPIRDHGTWQQCALCGASDYRGTLLHADDCPARKLTAAPPAEAHLTDPRQAIT